MTTQHVTHAVCVCVCLYTTYIVFPVPRIKERTHQQTNKRTNERPNDVVVNVTCEATALYHFLNCTMYTAILRLKHI